MRYRQLDLNLLIALDALLAERSVTRAAAKLNMTQPAMSGALARLRERFEDPLLLQVGRKMELTPRAEALLEPLHDIILRIDSTLESEPQFDASKSKRRFVIVASDYSIHLFLLPILKDIRRQAPGMAFEFRHPSKNAQADLEAGEIDFVIAPAIDTLAQHPHVDLFEDDYSIVASDANTVIGDTLSFDQFMAMGHVIFRAGDGSLPWFDRWFEQEYGSARRVETSLHSFELLPLFVLDSDLIAVLPTRLAKYYSQILPIAQYPLPLEAPVLTEVLQWNRYRDEDPANKWFRERLVEMADTFPATDEH